MSNLAEQYSQYFKSFQDAIQGLVDLVKAFTKTIQDFVNSFKKNITTGEDFKDSDED
jgi:hypothetical protein